MVTLAITTHSSVYSWSPKNMNKNSPPSLVSSFTTNQFKSKTHFSFSQNPKSISGKSLRFSIKAQRENEPTSSSSPSSATVVSEKPSDDNIDTQKSELSAAEGETAKESEFGTENEEKQQEIDWKTDEEFKKFMGNPSIEAAIKLEKKRADRKLKKLDRESSGNPVLGLFNKVVRDKLTREKERLEKAEETFRALNLNKVISKPPAIFPPPPPPGNVYYFYNFFNVFNYLELNLYIRGQGWIVYLFMIDIFFEISMKVKTEVKVRSFFLDFLVRDLRGILINCSCSS